jgi:hypothetical protein
LSWHFGALLWGDAGYESVDRFVAVGGNDRIGGLNREQLFVEYVRRREIVKSIPGVTGVAFGSPVPGAVNFGLAVVPIRDPLDATKVIDARLGSVNSEFIELFGLSLVHGRAPEYGETTGVVINQTLARAFWGRDDVVGEILPGNVRWGSEGANVLGVLEDLSSCRTGFNGD